jgi:hypothetical protein
VEGKIRCFLYICAYNVLTTKLLECSTIRQKGYCHTHLLNPFELHMLAGIAEAFLLVVVCRVFSTLVSSLAGAPCILSIEVAVIRGQLLFLK